ncbi:unnamed protein product [Symbiodinium microadriaticum]|nr:unnamed protein product [Symbiodinium microadriaticum]
MDMLRAALLRLVWMPDAAPGHGTLRGLQKVPEASLEQRNIKKVWRSGLADVCVHKIAELLLGIDIISNPVRASCKTRWATVPTTSTWTLCTSAMDVFVFPPHCLWLETPSLLALWGSGRGVGFGECPEERPWSLAVL